MTLLFDILYFFLYGRNFKKTINTNQKKIFNTDKEILFHKIKKSLINVGLEKNINIIDINNIAINNFDIQKSFHQYIWMKFINTNIFNTHLILSIALDKSFFFPIPGIYVDKISKLIRVNKFLSKFLWVFFIIVFSLNDLLKIFFSVLNLFKIKKDNFIYCKSLGNIIPNKTPNIKLDDFFLWFAKNFEIKNKSVFIHSNKKIKNHVYDNYVKKFFFSILFQRNIDFVAFDLKDIIYYFRAFYKIIELIAKIILTKKINSLIFLFEIFKFYLHFYSKKSFEYVLFNNSYMFYRPLWTYVHETKKKGSVLFYFYSINTDPLLHLIENKQFIAYDTFSFLSWDNYILWGKNQLNWLKNKNKFVKNFKLIDFVPFEGENIFIPKTKKKRLSIFDNLPRDDFNYYKLRSPYNIYNFDFVRTFIEDILNLSKEYNDLEIFLKSKRNNKTTHPEYLNYIYNLNKKYPNFKIIDTVYSAQSFIYNSDLTISIPYTSTALIAKSFNSKSIYYDPSGKLKEDSNNYHTIELIKDKVQLSKCLKKYLN